MDILLIRKIFFVGNFVLKEEFSSPTSTKQFLTENSV